MLAVFLGTLKATRGFVSKVEELFSAVWGCGCVASESSVALIRMMTTMDAGCLTLSVNVRDAGLTHETSKFVSFINRCCVVIGFCFDSARVQRRAFGSLVPPHAG